MTLAAQVGDIGVWMHAKDLRLVLIRHLLNVSSDLGNLVVHWYRVGAALGEPVVRDGDDIVILEDTEDAEEQDSVEVVGHVSTIVDATRHKLECIPWDLVLLKQEVLQHRY